VADSPLIILNTYIKSARFLLSSSDQSPNLLSLSLYGRNLRSGKRRINRCWTG